MTDREVKARLTSTWQPDPVHDSNPPASVPASDHREGLRFLAIVDALAGLGISLVFLAGLLATDADFGMVWDEGHTIRRERVLLDWFTRLASPQVGGSRWDMFSERNLKRYWPFSREEPDGHPPVYALLGLAGWRLTHTILPPLTAYRFGPIVLSAAAAGAIYHHLARRRNRLAGLTAAAAFVLMPNLLAHARYAHYDMPMTCFWLLAQMAFINALGAAAWSIPLGLCLGLAAGTKFTGWFAPAAPLLWVLWMEWIPRTRTVFKNLVRGDLGKSVPAMPGTRALLLAAPVAMGVLYLLQPHWWFEPITALRRFWLSNTSRHITKPIPTMYLGECYGFSLPWHNTLVLSAVTVPVLLQVLAGAGLIVALVRRRSEPWTLVWPLSWSVLMIVRALPTAPGHDGTRLFLPSIASLAILAGLGVGTLANQLKKRRLGWIAGCLAMAALAESILGIAQTYPYTLSYYNAAIGGLPGAERRGFELTYYWDTMGPEFLRWVRDESQRRSLELRFPSDLINVRYLREWGDLPATVPILGLEPVSRPDYVLQRRRGFFYPYDSWLEQNGHPEFVIRRQGVDLLRVYSFDESFQAFQATKDVPIPEHLRNED